MDEIKIVPRSRQRVASLPTTSTELNNSFQKLGDSLSKLHLSKRPSGSRRHSLHDPCISSTNRQWTTSPPTAATELNKSLEKLVDSSLNPNLLRARRHSLHELCTTSVKDASDGLKILLNPSAISSSPMDVRVRPFEACHTVKVQARKVCFPLSNGDQQFSLEPVARKAKIKVGKRNSWTCLRSAREDDNASLQDPKQVLPEITTNKLQISKRRQSLPILTEGRLTDNPLPQITQPENHSLIEQKSKDCMGTECLRFNGTRPCVKVTKLDDKRNQADAMREHVKKTENGYNENEMRAVRLFGWLKDQTDKTS